jgi:hypothetical protein
MLIHNLSFFSRFSPLLVILPFHFALLLLAQPPATSTSLQGLVTSSAKDIAYRLYVRQNTDPVSFEEWDKLNCRNKDVVAVGFLVEGKVEGYVSYELRPRGIHILNLSFSDKVSDPQIRAKCISQLVERLPNSRRLVATARSEALPPELQALLKTVGFQSLSPASRKKALGTAFHPKADLAIHYNHGLFTEAEMPFLTHFEKLGVTLSDNQKTIQSHYRILKAFYPDSSPWAAELKTAFLTLTKQPQRTEYIKQNAHRIHQPERKLTDAKPEPKLDSLDLYQRLGRKFLDGFVYPPERVQRDFESALVAVEGKKKALDSLAEARNVLGDPELRAVYDAILSTTEGQDQENAILRFLHSQFPTRYERPAAPMRVTKRKKDLPSEDSLSTSSFTSVRPLSNSLHERLGVAENMGKEKLWEAFRSALQQFPDITTLENRNLREAYAVLSDEENSAAYAAALSKKGKLNKTELTAFFRKLRTANKRNPTVPLPATDGGKNGDQVAKVIPNASNLYARLGVPENASPEKIFDAALDLLLKSRPNSKERESLFLTYTLLHHDDFRRLYDEIQQNLDGEDRKSAVDGLMEEVSILLAARAEAHSARQLPAAATLYSVLGVGPNASATTIERRFLERWNAATDDQKPELEKAFSVLRDPNLKRHYDAFLTQGATSLDVEQLFDLGKDRDALRRLRGIVADGIESPSLKEFIGRASPNAFSIHVEPEVGKAYLDSLQALLGKQLLPDWESLRALAAELERLKSLYGNGLTREMESFRSQLLQFRGDVAERVIAASREQKRDPRELYPNVRQGDIVHKLLMDSAKQNASPNSKWSERILGLCRKALSALKFALPRP